jgi:orotidine-5'-phosphate decarboxylase
MLIVALDPPYDADVLKWIEYRYNLLKPYVQGFKIGLPAILEVGFKAIGKILKNYEGLLIADLKLADIGDIMCISAERAWIHGFNAIIAHTFVGYEQALDKLSKLCRERMLKLILVVSMSHKGSAEFIDRHVEEFSELARKVRAWGIIAPATRPNVLKRIRAFVGNNIKILAPGIGTQGAEPGTAICNGADYEIVGRAITHTENVLENAFKIIEQQKEEVAKCRGLQ